MNILSIFEGFKEILYPMFGVLITMPGMLWASKFITPEISETEAENDEEICSPTR